LFNSFFASSAHFFANEAISLTHLILVYHGPNSNLNLPLHEITTHTIILSGFSVPFGNKGETPSSWELNRGSTALWDAFPLRSHASPLSQRKAQTPPRPGPDRGRWPTRVHSSCRPGSPRTRRCRSAVNHPPSRSVSLQRLQHRNK